MAVQSVSIVTPALSGGGMARACFMAQLFQFTGRAVEIAGVLAEGHDIYPLPPAESTVRPISPQNSRDIARYLARNLSGDVVYAIKPKPGSYGASLLARRLTARPLVLDIDDFERSYRTHGPMGQCKLWLLEQLVRMADAVTVSNMALRERFGGVCLPSGKDGTLFDPAAFDPLRSRRSLGLEGRFVLMFPGTPVPHSGLEDLLIAMERVGRQDWVLVVVGGRDSGHRYVSEQLSPWGDKIVSLPRCAPERMPEIIAAGHVIVVPHRDLRTARYNFPMKLTDGMAMGKPVLATRVGDIPAAVGDGGYLVDPGDPNALARALRDIEENPDEAALRGRLARERFQAEFSFEALAPRLDRVLLEAVGRRDRANRSWLP